MRACGGALQLQTCTGGEVLRTSTWRDHGSHLINTLVRPGSEDFQLSMSPSVVKFVKGDLSVLLLAPVHPVCG